MYTPVTTRVGQGKASIVIIDDEKSILKELKILLSRTYDIYTFTNPVEAEEFIDQNEVAMVISDELMPEMRGSVLLGRIHKKYPNICKIVLSGQAEKDDIVRAVNEGHIFSFLFKPVNKQQLMNVIQKGLEHRMMKEVMRRQNIELTIYSEDLRKMVEEQTAQLVRAHDRLRLLNSDKMGFLVYLSNEMDSSLDRIQKLTEALLNYFGLAGSELRLHKRPMSLRDIVLEILEQRNDKITKSKVVVNNRIEKDVVVQVDPEYMRQVLDTIIDNAITYSPEGGTVSIESSRARQKTRLSVSDMGKGIPEEDQKRIFRAFEVERGKRNFDGFGLNLPMAKIIVHAHGGKIWAESEGEGKGTTFFVDM